MIDRAEAVAAGKRPLKPDRFVKIADTEPVADWDLVERAQQVAGLKGYVTNIDPDTMTGEQVVAAYHDLYQVERSFRMTKSDLATADLPPAARQHRSPPHHRVRRAGPREAQTRTGQSINKIVKTLRPLHTATITLSGRQIQVPPRIPDEAQRLLDALNGGH